MRVPHEEGEEVGEEGEAVCGVLICRCVRVRGGRDGEGDGGGEWEGEGEGVRRGEGGGGWE